MYSFIVKKLFNKDKPEEAGVSVEVVKPETPKELFDKAVTEVVRKNLRDSLSAQLIEMCYTEEELKQTKKAVEVYGEQVHGQRMPEVREKYPLAQGVYVGLSGGFYSFKPFFSYNKFLDNLIEEV